MSKIVAIMSMSLDGYVADLNDGVAEVFDWYLNSGNVEIHTGGSDPMTFKVSEPSAEHLRGLISGLGAMLASPTKSTSTSRRFYLAPEFDSSTTSSARRLSLQPDGDRGRGRFASALSGMQGVARPHTLSRVLPEE